MATQTQVGVTVNARNLELMIRRFASHPLNEVNELGVKLFSLVEAIAPSIILFHKANDYDEKTYPALTKYANKILRKSRSSVSKQDVHLLDHTRNADERILTALLFKTSGRDYRNCRETVRMMSRKAKIALFKKSCQHLELYDATLREFEFANLTYSLLVSAACFGQLKRHRIASLTCQEYDPVLGYTIPESVKKVGHEEQFVEIIKKTEKMYKKIEKKL